MAEISKIQIPGNSTPYNLKDSRAVHEIKTVNSTSLEGSENIDIPDDQMIWFATCTTAAGTATKTISLADSTDTFSLVQGHTLRILFSNGNTTAGQVKFTCTGAFTNINAYSAYNGTYYMNLYYMWQANEVVDFVYDGTQFIMVDGGKADTTNYGLVKLSSSTSSSSTTLGADIVAFSAAITKYQSRVRVYTTTSYPYNTSYFTLYNTEYGEIYFKKYGHVAEISGQLKVSTAISGSTTLIDLSDAYIPSDYRPSLDINLIMPGSTYYVWLLTVGADGHISFSRYRCADSYVTAGVNVWVPFHASWIFE